MLKLSTGDRGTLRTLALVLLASFAVLALSGCGIFSPDESDDGGDPPVSDFKPTGVGDVPDGTARNNVIYNLERAYELMRYEQYEKLIHLDYVFRVDPAEIDIVGSAQLTAVEDLDSTEAMFSGATGEEKVLDPVTGQPTGEVRQVPPVQEITLDLTPDSSSSWTLMQDGEFAGSYRRVYDVDMTVYYSGDGRIDTIRGKQVFYVTPGTIAGDTSGKLYWQLRAWEDQGINS